MPDRGTERRRAELAGEAVLKVARTDPQFAAMLRDILNASITGRRNRELFDLKVEAPVRLLNREAQRAVFADLGADTLLGQ